MRALILAAITACAEPSPTTTTRPTTRPTTQPAPRAATPNMSTFALSFDEQPRTQHLIIRPPPKLDGIDARIAVDSFSGIDTISRSLPACIELPPGTHSIKVTVPVSRFAMTFGYDDEPGFDDACTAARRNSLPPAIR